MTSRPQSSFAARFSIEATRPSANEIDAIAAILPRGTEVYVTAVPKLTADDLVAAARHLRKAGLEPVPHIAARMLPDAGALGALLLRLNGEAAVRRLLVIGGDVTQAGPFSDALAVIQRGGLKQAGIEEIGIGAYPEGHPAIPPDRLEAALDEKIAAARAQGLRVTIVSQFSFSPERILAWLKDLRACGIDLPVKVGMVGPTSLTGLMRFARRCGVATSLRGLVSGSAANLVGHVAPDRIVDTLAAAGGIGDAAPHYFSFGGVLETARYACAAADGIGQFRRAMARTD